ncbi:MAG: hypothetical protein EOP09_01795 [Proteobacteria bacterium]|nr:MAG: hypothetical protein EOP09_01795 [Pseudomonadota bacterium]
MTLVLANSVSENGLWGAVIALAFTGIGTLLLHLFLIVGKSVADSQVPRIELIRKSLEDFCEGSFEFSRLGDLALKWHGKKALQPNFSKEELFEVQYVDVVLVEDRCLRCAKREQPEL